MMSPAELKEKLDSAIHFAVINRNMLSPGIDVNAFSRRRKLTMTDTINLLHFMSGGSLKKELYAAGFDVYDTAFVHNRAKIPPEIFKTIFRRFNYLSCNNDWKCYRGYRLLAVDGSCINMASNPTTRSFVCSDTHTRGGYNALHLNALYDVENCVYYDAYVTPQPCADEIGALITMLRHNEFQRKQIIICDRGYESYYLFAYFMQKKNVQFLCRVKQNKSAMREVAKLPMEELDVDVSFTITTTQTNEDKEKKRIFLQTLANKKRQYSSKTKPTRWNFPSPYPMSFRVVRFMLSSGEYETVATSLPRSFSSEDIKEIYHRRWGIETSFRHLKYTLGLSNLHGKSDNFVEQEIYTALDVYNFCSRIVNSVVLKKSTERIYAYKVNFKMAVYLCKEYLKNSDMDEGNLLTQIAKYTEPIRPGRMDKRNLRPKGFAGFIYRIAA